MWSIRDLFAEDLLPLIAFILSVVVLVTLVGTFRFSPIIALLISSIFLALTTGAPLAKAMEEFSNGVGAVLGSTAMVIALGAMIGILLQASGGATVIANKLIGVFGQRQIDWTMLFVGLLVGIGVWFTVGLVLLTPITFSLARQSNRHVLIPGLSMLAGLSAMHGLAPPHPGPLVAVSLLQADLGMTIVWSLIVGSLAAAIAGPMFWSLLKPPTEYSSTDNQPNVQRESTPSVPSVGFFAAITVLTVPILLMLVSSFIAGLKTDITLESAFLQYASQSFIALGHPTVALLVGLLIAFPALGFASGRKLSELSTLLETSLHPVANVLLIVGAGAGYSRVLIASGVGQALANLVQPIPLSIMILAWMIAAAFRIATGSATTAITTASGIIAGIVGSDTNVNRELLVLSLGAGSLTLSHVNDGGFWFVKEYLNLSVKQTLLSWTVLETVLSLVILAIILLFDYAF